MQLLLDIAMATGPVVGYILQSRLIVKNQSVGAFSTDICLVLLIANILRLNFYLFKTYDLALFFQSLFMITAQLVLLKICCLYRDAPKEAESDEQSLANKFWRWPDFTPYLQHTIGFFAATLSASTIMWVGNVQLYGELVGLISLLTESMLILPQILEIIKQGDVEGISYGLIGLNLLGDTYKTFYFFLKEQPFQFKLCAVIQLILDAVVISQIIYYRLRYRFTELPDEGNGEDKKKELQLKREYKNETNSDQLDGSLSQTIVVQEQMQDKQVKRESEAHLQ